MKSLIRITTLVAIVLLFLQGVSLSGRDASTAEIVPTGNAIPDEIIPSQKAKAAVIECKGMIDDGLYKSIIRRTEQALASGADYIIYNIGTYGGLVKTADDISKYFILEIADKAHTVAYVETEAISAGSMISVSCNDIIMRKNTLIGDCAPIVMGGKLEGTEREKAESFIRATFERAARANGYPEILLKSMATDRLKVYRVKNIETDKFEFFDADIMPKDPNVYDLDNKELVVKEGELLTMSAEKALEYGITRAVVDDIDDALAFLAQRDGVEFEADVPTYTTNWSEEMVRWLNSPAVTGILFMLALLGFYVEINTPGLGLPGLVAVICFAILFGSRFLVDLANWVEVAIFIIGIALILVEFFVIPGFGVTGILGIILILGGIFGMLVRNPPDKLPIPQNQLDWIDMQNGILGLSLGFVGFIVVTWILSKYLPKFAFFNRLLLEPPKRSGGGSKVVIATPVESQTSVKVGDIGIVTSTLRPAGVAKFDDAMVDVVSDGEFVDNGAKVKIISISGNRVTVEPLNQQEEK